MSGLLHRLAAQAMGSAAVVRTAARLPFSAAPDRVEMPAPVETPSAPPIMSRHPAERSRPAQDIAHPPPSPADAVVAATTSEAVVREARPQPVLGAGPLSAIAATDRARPAAPPEELAKSRPIPTRPDIAAKPARDEGAMPLDAAPDQTEIVARRMASPMEPRRGFPEPLLPQQPPSPSAGFRTRHGWGMHAAPAPAAGVHGRHATTGEEIADVHVTIGRIELTAIQEAPRANPPARRGAQPMTLDDYLARRRGGRT